MSECSERKIVELAKYKWATEQSGPGTGPGFTNSRSQPSGLSNQEIMNIMMRDENWETEATIKESYNPVNVRSLWCSENFLALHLVKGNV